MYNKIKEREQKDGIMTIRDKMIKKYESESESEEDNDNDEDVNNDDNSDSSEDSTASISIIDTSDSESIQEITVVDSTPIKTCSAILKSGFNKGKLCGISTQNGTYCKRHNGTMH